MPRRCIPSFVRPAACSPTGRGATTAFGGSAVATNRALAAASARDAHRLRGSVTCSTSTRWTSTRAAASSPWWRRTPTSGAVLMVAHADREALERTLATGEMHYRSRTRGLWHKGATSGNVQRVVSLSPDCDGDAVLARVSPGRPGLSHGDDVVLRRTPRSRRRDRHARRDHRRAQRGPAEQATTPHELHAPAARPTATCDSRSSARKRPSW